MTEKRFIYYEEDLGAMVLPKCLDNGKTVAKSVYECVDLLNQLNDENEQLKSRIKELEIENEAQSDAIDGLQETICHFDLEEIIK